MLEHSSEILQIIFADIILSGDNALVIGMAAAGLSPIMRKRAIFMGMALAAGLRIFFAAIASYLLAIPGILFIGGCLLAFVCYRFFIELKQYNLKDKSEKVNKIKVTGSERSQLIKALVTITIADISMSIDNVVAVAAIARENTSLLIFGLIVAIAFMAFFATMIMKLMTKYTWLSWAGLIFLLYLTYKMIHDGFKEISPLLF
jgi:YjbE family integral membrane protein|tara:strand:- start:486 stop:1094 length:609 start_codon:yes stop_codon:yes gene_type:complete